MLVSLPANPVPTDLHNFIRGTSSRVWLPWYIWGGGAYSTKYDYDTSQYHGYLGTVSVPLAGESVSIRSLRLQAAINGVSFGGTEGAMVRAILYQQSGNLSSPIATILVDRRTVPNSSIGDVHVDIVQSTGGFVASASTHELSIQLLGKGQGIATIHGLVVDLGY